MEMLILGLIASIVAGGAAYNFGLDSIMNIAFYAEKELHNLSISGLNLLFTLFLGYGISLIVLKFLKKGFDIYILEVDGDADLDPIVLLTNFFRAMAIAIGFPTIYEWCVKVIQEASTKALDIIGLNTKVDFDLISGNIATSVIFAGILYFIFFVIFIYLYIKFLMIGLEILILRAGLPLACGGLMDADKGVFRSYIQKFIQSFFTVLIQVLLAKFGLALMINGHLMWGIASLLLAIKTPRFLQEFLITSSGGGLNGVYQSARMVQMARTTFFRGR